MLDLLSSPVVFSIQIVEIGVLKSREVAPMFLLVGEGISSFSLALDRRFSLALDRRFSSETEQACVPGFFQQVENPKDCEVSSFKLSE